MPRTKPSYEELARQVAFLNDKISNLVDYQEEREKRENVYQEILDAVPSFVFWKDSSNNILGFNRAYQQFVNISPEDLLSKTGFELFPDADKYWEDDKEVIESGIPKLNIEEEVVIPPGKTIWFKTDKVPLRNEEGKSYGVIGVSIDITQVKEYQAKLEKSLEANERKNRELAEARRAAEEASQAKSDFLANMSHELRTPLNAILGFSEILQNQLQDNGALEHARTINTSGRTLLYLINDLLDLSKIEAGRLDLNKETVDLERLLEEVRMMFVPALAHRPVSLTVELEQPAPGALVLDAVRLKQILVNLVGNALKFTREGSVRLSVDFLNSHANDTHRDLLFTVQDTGIGISPDKVAKIFEKFMQGTPVGEAEGAGLGLSITKRLVELMGGHIEVESELGRGSCFRVSLPEVAVESRLVEERPFIDWSLYAVKFFSQTLLVVDDVQANRELIRSYLHGLDLTLLEAGSGREALNILDNHVVDLVLMDIRMPEMDGFQTAAVLRQRKTDLPPLIAFTASTNLKDQEKIRLAFKGTLRKPVDRNELLQLLGEYLPHQIEERLGKHEERASISDVIEHREGPIPLKGVEAVLSKQAERLAPVLDVEGVADFLNCLNLLKEQQGSTPYLDTYYQQLSDAHRRFDYRRMKSLLRSFPSQEIRGRQ